MSKKHYIAMAMALRAVRPWHVDGTSKPGEPLRRQWELCVRAAASVFARDNGRFNRDRFYAASGLEQANAS